MSSAVGTIGEPSIDDRLEYLRGIADQLDAFGNVRFIDKEEYELKFVCNFMRENTLDDLRDLGLEVNLIKGMEEDNRVIIWLRLNENVV